MRHSAEHVPGSYNIMLSAVLSTFAGWILPPEIDILLVASVKEEALVSLCSRSRDRRFELDGVLVIRQGYRALDCFCPDSRHD